MKGDVMLGFGDFWVALAYFSCIASALLCVIYGAIHWNDTDEFPAPVHPPGEDLEFEEEV
jgi:hypothetical protein